MEALATLGAVVCRAVWGPKDRQGLNGKAMSTVGPGGRVRPCLRRGARRHTTGELGAGTRAPDSLALATWCVGKWAVVKRRHGGEITASMLASASVSTHAETLSLCN